MSTERKYTLSQIEAAFRAQFHKAGELWFPYGDDESAEEATRHAWEEFTDELNEAADLAMPKEGAGDEGL